MFSIAVDGILIACEENHNRPLLKPFLQKLLGRRDVQDLMDTHFAYSNTVDEVDDVIKTLVKVTGKDKKEYSRRIKILPPPKSARPSSSLEKRGRGKRTRRTSFYSSSSEEMSSGDDEDDDDEPKVERPKVIVLSADEEDDNDDDEDSAAKARARRWAMAKLWADKPRKTAPLHTPVPAAKEPSPTISAMVPVPVPVPPKDKEEANDPPAKANLSSRTGVFAQSFRQLLKTHSDEDDDDDQDYVDNEAASISPENQISLQQHLDQLNANANAASALAASLGRLDPVSDHALISSTKSAMVEYIKALQGLGPIVTQPKKPELPGERKFGVSERAKELNITPKNGIPVSQVGKTALQYYCDLYPGCKPPQRMASGVDGKPYWMNLYTPTTTIQTLDRALKELAP